MAPVNAPSGDASLIAWQPLTWDDFVVDDVRPGLSAETVSFLRFRYKMQSDTTKNADGTTTYTTSIKQITFTGGFDKSRSWRRSKVKNDPALLRHEQGHLDLNEIKRRQLQALPLASLPVGHGATMSEANADLSQKLGEWFRGEMFALRTRQLQYDDETKFGMNKKPQASWITQIDKDMAALSSFAESTVAVSAPTPPARVSPVDSGSAAALPAGAALTGSR